MQQCLICGIENFNDEKQTCDLCGRLQSGCSAAIFPYDCITCYASPNFRYQTITSYFCCDCDYFSYSNLPRILKDFFLNDLSEIIIFYLLPTSITTDFNLVRKGIIYKISQLYVKCLNCNLSIHKKHTCDHSGNCLACWNKQQESFENDDFFLRNILTLDDGSRKKRKIK